MYFCLPGVGALPGVVWARNTARGKEAWSLHRYRFHAQRFPEHMLFL